MNDSRISGPIRALTAAGITRKPRAFNRSSASLIEPQAACEIMLYVLLTAGAVTASWADTGSAEPDGSVALKRLSLEELGSVEVTTASKKPEQVWRTPAAIYVLTNEDIRRSGATSIPEVLRLVPGVEVARVNSNVWAVGIRGFGSAFSKSVWC
jgi:iron complex outermembrane receptor protein